MSEDKNLAPAGWYDDKTGRKRWWNGRKWGKLAPEFQTQTCRRCGQDGPILSKKCPSCGKRYKSHTQLKLWGAIATLSVLLFVGFAIVFKQGWDEEKERMREASITRAQFRSIQVGATEKAVRSKLKVDPYVEYDDQEELCIEYNQKHDGWFFFTFCFKDGVLTSKQAW